MLLFLKWPSSPTGTHDFHKLPTLYPLDISKLPPCIPLSYPSHLPSGLPLLLGSINSFTLFHKLLTLHLSV